VQAAIQQNSSLLAPIANADLSPAQAEVIAALAQGHTVTAAARDAGIHRTTIHHWLRHEPAFKAAVQTAQANM
jgi:DNA-binding NarL/FixJ family response regulator